MGRELLVALFVVAMSCGAFAQSDMPVVTPTATPLPPTPVKNFSFVLYDTHNSSAVCLRMTAAIVVNVTYIDTDGKNISKTVAVTNQPSIGANSMCDINSTKATLMVTPDFGDDEMGTYWIIFTFTGDNTTGNNHWSWSNISFTLEREYMENYAGGAGDDLEFNTTDALHEEPNSRIEFERSYQCVSSQVLNFTKANQVNPFVYISQLQVQAFHFRYSNGSFDDARVCLLDTAGKANKIVPIAVGAALAGLVVVVLIAYLIGRLRSRRQSSYEALS